MISVLVLIIVAYLILFGRILYGMVSPYKLPIRYEVGDVVDFYGNTDKGIVTIDYISLDRKSVTVKITNFNYTYFKILRSYELKDISA
jgi:hypothetical protein